MAAQNATTQAFPAFQAKMTSSATTGSATTAEEDVIRQMLASIQGLANIRPAILARAITPTEVFGAFSNILTQELQLFIKENASLTNAPAATQSLAIINSTESGELLSQEDALVSASLAAQQLTTPTRIQVTQLAGARQAMYQAAITRLDASRPGRLQRADEQVRAGRHRSPTSPSWKTRSPPTPPRSRRDGHHGHLEPGRARRCRPASSSLA